MKLNLLPATVSRGRATRTAWIITIVFALLSILASAAMMIKSGNDLKRAESAYNDAQPAYNAAVDMSGQVETMMALPQVQALSRNVDLAHAMINHNDDYPVLYHSMLQYVPPFYRVTSLSASPMSDSQASVNIVGTLGSFQQYADLMLALMRNPNAVSVTRSGYVDSSQFVPNLVESDQTGRPRLPNQSPIPDDPLQRLAFFESSSQPAGYSGAGNFGTGTDATRGAMPGQSLVSVQIVVNAKLQTPNPRQTLSSGGGAAAPSGGMPGPGGPSGPPMGGPKGAPPGPMGPGR
jgi:hypothetical protein